MITGNVKEGSSAPAGPMVRYRKPPSGVAPGGEDKHTSGSLLLTDIEVEPPAREHPLEQQP